MSKKSKSEIIKSTKYDNATHLSINPKPPLLIRLFGHSLFLILFISIVSTFIEPFDVTILLPLYRDNYMQSKFDPIKKYILKDVLLSSDYFHQLKNTQRMDSVNNSDNQLLKQYMKLQSNIDSDFSSLVELILGDDTFSLPSSSSITQSSFDYSVAFFFNFFTQSFRNNSNKFDILNYIAELEAKERKFNITILSPQDESLWSSESTLLRFIVSNPYERYQQSQQHKEIKVIELNMSNNTSSSNSSSSSSHNKKKSSRKASNIKSKTRKSSRKSFLEYNITLDGIQLLFPESQQCEFSNDSIINSITNKSNNYNTSVSSSDSSTSNQTSINNNNNHSGNLNNNNNNKSNINCRNIIPLEVINNQPIEMGVDLLQHGLKAGPHCVTVDILLDMQEELWGADAITYFYYFPSNAELHIRHTDGTSRPFAPTPQQQQSLNSQSIIQSIDHSKQDSVTTTTPTTTNQHTATDHLDSMSSDGNYFIPSTSAAVIGWRKTTTVESDNHDNDNNNNNNIAAEDSTHSAVEVQTTTTATSSTSPLSVTHPVMITSPRNHDAVGYKFTLEGAFPTIYLTYTGLKVVLQHNDQQIFDLTERVREKQQQQQQQQGQPQQQQTTGSSLSELQLTTSDIQDVTSFKIDLEGLDIGTHTIKIHIAEVETASTVITSKDEQPARIIVTSEIITFRRV